MTERETPITARCKAWRDVLPVHSAAEIIPAYDDAKLLALGRDIKAGGGMKMPVIVLAQPDGTHSLLDGRSRLDALVHVGIKFEVKVIDGHIIIDAPDYDIPAPSEIPADADFDAIGFVLSINLRRRHVTNGQKRAIIKKVIEAQPALSDRAIAKMADVSDKTVKPIRLQIEANAEIRIGDRVEATGRKARGRKPKPTEPTNAFDSTDSVVKPVEAVATPAAEKSPVIPIETVPAKIKPKDKSPPALSSEIFAAAQRVSSNLNRQPSSANYDDLRKEARRLVDFIIGHGKTSKPNAGTPARAA
jgi:hypothetical protein